MAAQFPNSYQNTFDPSLGFVKSLYFPGKGYAAYEINNDQSMFDHKRAELAKLIVSEGDIVKGASPVVNNSTGLVRIPAGQIFIRNELIDYPESEFTIAIDKRLKLGVFLEEIIISGGNNLENNEHPSLIDPSAEIDGKIYATSGTETSKKLKYKITWGWKDTVGGASQPIGIFYESFTVEDGVLILPTIVTSKSGIIEEIANYDRDVNGDYIVEGLEVSYDYEQADGTKYILNVTPGRANINGYKRPIPTNRQFELPIDPDLRRITGDPFVITVESLERTATITRGAGNTDTLGRPDVQTIESVTSLDGNTVYTQTTDYILTGNAIDWSPNQDAPAEGEEYLVTFTFTGAIVETDRGPVDNILSVLVPLQITDETVVRGAISNSTDSVANTSLVSLVEVKQGATIYQEGTDYILTGSTINWAPGGAEPAPSSSYTVTYIYNRTITADEGSIDNTFYTITNKGAQGNLVSGSTVLTNYDYRLPRIDLLEFTQSGQLRRIKGVSQDARPNAPKNSPDAIGLATIKLDWINDPAITKVGNVAIKQSELQGIKNRLYTQGVLLAELKLLLNASLAGASNAGIFVDSFVDIDNLDLGATQTLKIVDNTLTIPLTLTRSDLSSDANNEFHTLVPTDDIILAQDQTTASMRINPFATFVAPQAIIIDNKIDHQVDDTTDDTIIGVINPDPITINNKPTPTPVINKDDGTSIKEPETPTVVDRLRTLTDLRQEVKDLKGIKKIQPAGKKKTLNIITKLNSGESLGVVKIGSVSVDYSVTPAVIFKNKKK
jgi:hypothetical protein